MCVGVPKRDVKSKRCIHREVARDLPPLLQLLGGMEQETEQKEKEKSG